MKRYIALLLRKKTVLLVTLLGPLFILLLAGLTYDNTNSYSFTIGVVNVNTSDSDSLIATLQNSSFIIISEVNTSSCISKVEKSVYHACISFSDGFVSGSPNNVVTFYVDPSRVQILSKIEEKFQEHITLQAQTKSLGLAGDILTTISAVKTFADTGVKSSTDAISSNEKSVSILGDVQKSIDALNTAPTVPGAGMVTTHKDVLDAQIRKTISLTLSSIVIIQRNIDNISATDNGATVITSKASSISSTLSNLSAQMTIDSNVTNATLLKLNDTVGSLTAELVSLTDVLKKSTDEKIKVKDGVSNAVKEIGVESSKMKDVQSSLSQIITQLNGLTITDASQIAMPIVTKTNSLNVQKTNLPYTFPILAVLILSLTAILITPALVVYDKTSSAHIREQLSPKKSWKNTFEIFFVGLIVTLTEAILVFVLLSLFQSINVDFVPGMVYVLIMSSIVFTSFGLLIGTISKSEEVALFSSIAVIIIMLILSDIILPLATVPQIVQDIAMYNPLHVSTQLLRTATIHGGNIDFLFVSSKNLWSVTIIIFAIVLFLRRNKIPRVQIMIEQKVKVQK